MKYNHNDLKKREDQLKLAQQFEKDQLANYARMLPKLCAPLTVR